MNVQGLGLYAIDPALYKSLGKTAQKFPEEDPSTAIFENGQLIDKYVGEVFGNAEETNRLRYKERNWRRSDNVYAYAVKTADRRIVDSLCAYGALSYANDGVNVVQEWDRARNIDHFKRRYNAEDEIRNNIYSRAHDGGSHKIYARRRVHHGEELFLGYGADYWIGFMNNNNDEE
jgi:hypothetical protein